MKKWETIDREMPWNNGIGGNIKILYILIDAILSLFMESKYQDLPIFPDIALS
jgi:hypothetical protein